MRNIATKVTGSSLTADEFNDIPTELENAITSTDITLSAGDLTQLSQAVATYAAGGAFYTDSGSSTLYVLGAVGNKHTPIAYFNGMSVSFVASNNNSTATPTINVAGLGVKNILADGGGPLSVNDITTSRITTLVYDGTDFTLNTAISGATVNHINVAAAVADLGLVVGNRVKTDGYTTSAIGGSGDYLVVAGATGTPDGGRFIDLDNGNQIELQIGDNIVLPEQYGCVGDGATDDLVNMQAAFDNNDAVRFQDGSTYDIGGNTLNIPQNFQLYCTHKAILQNGELLGVYSQGENIFIEDLFMKTGNLNIGGAELPANHMTGLTFGKLRFEDCRAVFRYVTGMKGDSIDIKWNDDLGVAQDAFAPVCWYECEVNRIRLEGYYSMGFQTVGNGTTNDIFATFNTKIGQLISIRNPLSAPVLGHHGFYLLGNYGLKIEQIYSIGYFIENVSSTGSNAVKFRDNRDCTIDSIICDRMQIASDANLGDPLLSNQYNRIGRIDMRADPLDDTEDGDLTVTTSGSGFIEDVDIGWFRGRYATSGSLATAGRGGIIFTGNVTFTNTAEDIQGDGTLYYGADVTWAAAGTQFYIRQMFAEHSTFRNAVRTNNTSITMHHCNVEDLVRLDSTSGTRSIVLKNCEIGGSLTTISTGSRLIDADIANTNVNGNNFTGDGAPDNVIRYRNLSFDNGYWPDETAFITTP